MATTITKSKYMAGVQCLKRLYLLVQSPELGTGKSASDFARMEAGREVGKLARQLFPRGVEVRTGNPQEAIRITQELISNPDIPAILEGAFEYEGVFVRVDILQRRRDGRWRLIEVKSSASMKEEHVEDVAIQYHVVSNCGVNVASCHLAIVNRQYVFPGGSIDPWRFFRIKNLTRRVKQLEPKLTFQLRSELRVLAMPMPPPIDAGKQCLHPVICEFFDYCNPPRPDDHIGYLPYIHASAVEELAEMGVESIGDIPDDFELTEIQRRAATSVQTGTPWFGPDLGKELESLQYLTPYAQDEDWIFPSFKMHGKIPMCAGIFVTDHLRPAALAAGIEIAEGQRFGLHSLRSSMATWMVSIDKTDVKTAQGNMRHAGPEIMLRSYAQVVTPEMQGVQVRWFESCGLGVGQNLLAENAGSDAIQ